MFGEDSKETVMIGACESSLWNAGERAARISNPNCRHLGFTVGVTLLFDGESAYCRKKLRTKGDRFSMKRTATTVLVFLVLTLASASTSAATLAEGSLPVNITVDECASIRFNETPWRAWVTPDDEGCFQLTFGEDLPYTTVDFYANKPVVVSASATHGFPDEGASLADDFEFFVLFSLTGLGSTIPLNGQSYEIDVDNWSHLTWGHAHASV
ncbi:MAG: hypothetical protein GX872_01510, partial [Firmicutes bacterium]|nr:hypothetical protein [Bacillota bacterium]